ncbi:hypothetical protein Mapa_010287 [Marchantia paleacea]|nr:hypothetical protein Mapa_010287 [Marchantia paleacea]
MIDKILKLRKGGRRFLSGNCCRKTATMEEEEIVPAMEIVVECNSETAVFKKLSTCLGWRLDKNSGSMSTTNDRTLLTVSKNAQP